MVSSPFFCAKKMKNILNHLFDYKTFSRGEAKEILSSISLGKYNTQEITAFITAFRMRKITVDELQGFRDAMLDLATPVDLGTNEIIDLCGTGGDGKDTFNISTLASFVVAGAGYKVAKHGNYGVSSSCGSSNVFEYLGGKFTNNIELLKHQLDQAGICFLHAPLFNEGMKRVAPIRKELGVKTFFNMLGPMINPAKPKFQVTGVFDLELARLYAYLYQDTGNNYTIIHSLDGYDEISLTGAFKVYSNKGESVVNVEDLGFEALSPKDIEGGNTVASSAQIFINVLNGEGTQAQNNVVLTNAATAIQTIQPYKSFTDCYYEAEESLLRKNALQSFNTLIS